MKGHREERCVRCSCDYIASADGLDYVSDRTDLRKLTDRHTSADGLNNASRRSELWQWTD